jgi:hypothetical protein
VFEKQQKQKQQKLFMVQLLNTHEWSNTIELTEYRNALTEVKRSKL